jgi:hypothetical protein
MKQSNPTPPDRAALVRVLRIAARRGRERRRLRETKQNETPVAVELGGTAATGAVSTTPQGRGSNAIIPQS